MVPVALLPKKEETRNKKFRKEVETQDDIDDEVTKNGGQQRRVKSRTSHEKDDGSEPMSTILSSSGHTCYKTLGGAGSLTSKLKKRVMLVLGWWWYFRTEKRPFGDLTLWRMMALIELRRRLIKVPVNDASALLTTSRKAFSSMFST
ncbi:hypothetical protein Salat_1541800 [Sesamum alatum]|uniref:Uncharacterized protein n=1 Tax=Sesamum alatum TaxID=300844 RepID=A0AAE2CML3_9LAMI|nr:hypothetical protein Salat_1541800 [Sesamum alatum]